MIIFGITQIMQNLSNFPSSAPRANPSVEYLQDHIRELTAYINENNQKYHRNMVTLKEFYQEQNAELHYQKEELFAENNKQANQIITLRDLLAAANLKLKQNQERLAEAEERGEEIRQRLQGQRERNQKMYEQLKSVRKICQQELDTSIQALREIQDQNRGLVAEIKQKDDQIEDLTRKVQELEVKVTENFLLPGKIQEMEKEGMLTGLKVQEFNRKFNEINQQLSSTKLQLERCMSENQSLRIAKGNFNAQKKLQVQSAVKREREAFESRLKHLQTQNQNYIYQLNEAESRIKMSAKEIVALQNELKRLGQANLQMQKQMALINSQKDDYLKEFSGLKAQYEGVIQRLEDTLITYQKKNWDLEQENKDLNGQLDALQELLTEVKSMNNLQANRAEYRKLAELEVIARQTVPKAQEPSLGKNENEDKYRGEFDGEWQRLMGQIDRIST